jgi:DNA-binding IclR family transcriptional regulator
MPTRSPAPRDSKSRILSYGKMSLVLDCFSPARRELSLLEVSRIAGLPSTTAHRILSALREIGFVEQSGRGGDYALGLRLVQLGSLALRNMDLHREAKPFIDRLARLSGESVHLGVFNGLDILVIEREEAPDRGGREVDRTEIAPAHCTGLGKAVLAFQDRGTIDRVVNGGLKAFTPNTVTSRAALDKDLARVRRQGYAVDNGEHEMWVHCVAAPIRNGSGDAFAALSVTGLSDRITADRYEMLSGMVIQTADAISRQLGYAAQKASA